MSLLLQMSSDQRQICLLALLCSVISCSGNDTNFAGKPREEKQITKQEDQSQVPALPTTIPVQPPPVGSGSRDAFIGGSDQLFHIGDGDFHSGSACYNEIVATNLTGTTYIFPFKVTENATPTSISIDKICGTDLGNNYVHFYKDTVLSGSQAIGKGAISHNFTPSPLLLDIGEYQIHVISTKTKTDLFSSDYDDFLVGKIRIQATKPALIPGNVITR